MIRIYKKEDLPQIYKIMGYGFNWGNTAINNAINESHVAPNEIFFVDDDNNVIKSCIALITYDVNFEGTSVKFGGIGGVASLPEYRDNGNIKEIMTCILNYMKEHDIIISGLGPFAYEYYRKFGYEWTHKWKIVSVNLQDLKNFPKADKYVNLTKDDAKITEKLRNEFCKNLNSSVIRNDYLINAKWDQYYNNNYHVYGAIKDDTLVSYMVYQIEHRKINVKEMYYKDELSRQYLLHFLYTHRSNIDQVEFILTPNDKIREILPSPRISASYWPDKAGRVVDVLKTLNLLNVKKSFKTSFTLKVFDNIATFNEGVYKIFTVSNKLAAMKINEETADFEIDINRLSQLCFGHIDGHDAIKLNFVKVNNYKKEFEDAFNYKEIMMWQEF